MKKNGILLILILLSVTVNAQFIIGDTDDRSSILNAPTSVGVDVADEKLNFEFNNIHGQTAYEDKFLFGLKYSGGNTQGISRVFKGGDFVFGSQLNGFLAFSFLSKDSAVQSNENLRDIARNKQDSINRIFIKQLDGGYKNFKSLFSDSLKTRIIKILLFNDASKDTIDSDIYFQDIYIDTTGNELKNKSYRRYLGAQGFNTIEINAYRNFMITTLNKIDSFRTSDDYVTYQEAIDKVFDDITKYNATHGVRRITIFGRGGLNGKKFNLIDSLSNGDIKFNENRFRGGFIEVGANLFLKGKYYFGISYLHDWIDKLSDLTETEFARTVSDTIQDKVYQYKETKKVFVGKDGKSYDKYEMNILYVDWAILFPFEDNSTLIVSPYYRRNIVKKSIGLKNTSDIGVSLNWHKNYGSFIFGIFLEAPDIGNANDTDRDFHEKLSFGFRTNYSFNTLVGFTR